MPNGTYGGVRGRGREAPAYSMTGPGVKVSPYGTSVPLPPDPCVAPFLEYAPRSFFPSQNSTASRLSRPYHTIRVYTSDIPGCTCLEYRRCIWQGITIQRESNCLSQPSMVPGLRVPDSVRNLSHFPQTHRCDYAFRLLAVSS